jgi:hypothetical protein
MLGPKSSREDTRSLPPGLQRVLLEQLNNRAIIFVGYGGNDEGVHSFIASLDDEALSSGIYWVTNNLPTSRLGEWFKQCDHAF